MIDYAKLVGYTAPVDEALETFEFKPKGFENGNGEPLRLMIHPSNGTRFKKALRYMTIKAQRDVLGADAAPLVDDMEATLEETDANIADLLSRCTDGWNLMRDGEPVEFAQAACRDLYIAVPTLREAVDIAGTKAGKKPRAKKTA